MSERRRRRFRAQDHLCKSNALITCLRKQLLFKDTDVPISYLKAIVRNSKLDAHVTGVKLEVLSEESQKRVRFEVE